MEKFTLRPDEDYIQLNDLLKVLNWVGSGGEAKIHISEGLVTVNDEVETRVRKKVRTGDRISFNGQEATVA
ncbi:RNA-binding S4 domain-containing protein [Marinoscillum furvescens]|uniref:Ribosome-associated protein n=1 Tax=Marinoscillum furvescens DSM 4134 TaxID=1122208 RepID=A0A3D9L8T3_MARFU|nr:RNA-binding S4 domain-containing protein [Marinoscillum furvescens]REE02094.1 ribosome-associated protein [Marinoscillum furvescens DSM 4134]